MFFARVTFIKLLLCYVSSSVLNAIWNKKPKTKAHKKLVVLFGKRIYIYAGETLTHGRQYILFSVVRYTLLSPIGL